jgi:CRISPR-associated protein Csb1
VTTLEQFDYMLTTDTVAALTAHQLLEPVEGPGGVVFPPTFAPASKGEKGGYNIDSTGGSYQAVIDYQPPKSPTVTTDIKHDGGGNVCIIDTVGAEANRIEPLFKPDKCDGKYAGLVPQVLIKVKSTVPGKEREWTVNLLDAGHRAGDALIRFTKFGEPIFEAFKAYAETGNAEKLARLAPTSLVFGVWDSRGTQEKIARIFRSVVRATNVTKLSRSAQYFRSVKYVENGLVPEDLDQGDGEKNPLSREGFNDNPAGGAHGGVVVNGEIRRDMTINLAALRRLRVPDAQDPTKADPEKTLVLRRYILGLSLVAATAPSEDRYNLREGCQLRLQNGFKTVWQEVRYEEGDQPLPDLPSQAFEYAKLAAEAFKVTPTFDTEFDAATAEKWLRMSEDQQKKLRLVAPMTKQQFDSPGVVSMTGTVVSIQPDATGMKLLTKKGKSKQEVEIPFSAETTFIAKDGSAISVGTLAANNKVEVKLAGGVANSVTLK